MLGLYPLSADSIIWIIKLAFVCGYSAIIFEHYFKVNKAATALLMAAFIWGLEFYRASMSGYLESNKLELAKHIGNISELIFFLLGAMTIVEIIDSHKGFQIILNLHSSSSKRMTVLLISLITFFTAAILDSLATTIVVISLTRRLLRTRSDRLLAGGLVVIAANSGGAWSPIGAVTTTMLWIEGNVTTQKLVQNLFIPSLVSLIIPLALLLIFEVKGELDHLAKQHTKTEPGAKRVFFLGVGSLLFVPFFKWLTDLPPYMGVLAGLAVMWIVTDLIHSDNDDRRFLTVAHALTRVDSSSVLFFLGILLSVAGLEVAGVLQGVAKSLGTYIGDHPPALTSVIGLISAVLDNIPLVAACMKMYRPEIYPPDSNFWQMIAYCAATGGSILVIGSAAGVAFMSIERVPFTWYLRRISGPALLGYLGGIACYWLVHL